MADKQTTIINGVDVSWCDFYSMDGGCASESYYCKDDNRCYYKQLKRKEQECEELKKRLKILEEDIEQSPLCFHCKEENCIRKEAQSYKQALERIKEFCLTYSANHDAYETVYKHILNMIDEVL